MEKSEILECEPDVLRLWDVISPPFVNAATTVIKALTSSDLDY